MSTPASVSPARSKSADLDHLYELWGELRDLKSLAELLDWDQETKMPDGAADHRAKMAASLAGTIHQKLTSDRLWDAILAAEEAAEAAGDELEAAQAREAKRDVERARRIPESLAKAMAEASSLGTTAWQKARKASDFGAFQGHLERLLALAKEKAAALDPHGNAYDALLDDFEPGAAEADLVPLFDDLVAELSPLVREIAECGRTVDESPVLGTFDAEPQRALAHHAVSALGFDFTRGRMDLSTHPFCVGVTPTDVRMTWRFMEGDLRSALYGVLHESGHGMYEQGIPSELWRTPLGDAVSLGIHESQSRLWENQVGRSLGFWRWLWPQFAELFPEHAATTSPEEVWPALHTVRPSLIRVEADEATYNLHIAIRFRIERALFSGDLTVADLPQAWNDAYDDLLGIRPENDADGVLQDIHWSQALFGYFPTYTLGTLVSAQLFTAAESALGPLDEAFGRGEFKPLLGWLRDNVHRHGRRYEASELVQRATGRTLAADDLLAYLRASTSRAYGI